MLFVLTGVDDLVIAEISQTEINKFKSSLESKYKMDNRGDFEWFLGMLILKTEKGKVHSKHFRTVQYARLQTRQNTSRK